MVRGRIKGQTLRIIYINIACKSALPEQGDDSVSTPPSQVFGWQYNIISSDYKVN